MATTSKTRSRGRAGRRKRTEPQYRVDIISGSREHCVKVVAGSRHYHLTRGPDRHSETVVPYYQAMADLCEAHFGRRPSRNTLYKYLQRGFPVRKNGPYVHIPTFSQLTRPMTTDQAMGRWLTLVNALDSAEA